MRQYFTLQVLPLEMLSDGVCEFVMLVAGFHGSPCNKSLGLTMKNISLV